jgi:nucleoid DNA-binding protein
LTRSEIVNYVARAEALNPVTVRRVIDAVLDYISLALIEGEPAKIPAFGVFYASKRKARLGYDPATGGKVPLAATYVAKFRPSRELSRRINLKGA